jgi:hypothetical protein
MKKFFLILLFPLGFFAQKNVSIQLEPYASGNPLTLNVPFIGWDGKLVSVEHFNYYLSKLTIQHDGGQVLTIPDSVFLIKPTEQTLNLGFLNLNNIEQISFLVGVPKELNTQSGLLAQDISTYPDNHPLSFQSPSMYWGWQFGYMHMIVGGKVDGDNDGVAEKAFELHNLGNLNQQQINLSVVQTNVSSTELTIDIRCNLDNWLRNIDLVTAAISHGETGVNEQVMNNAPTQNVFNQAANASLTSNSQALLKIKTSLGTLSIEWEGMQNIQNCLLFDIEGKLLRKEEIQETSESVYWPNLKTGMGLVQLNDATGKTIATRKVVIP